MKILLFKTKKKKLERMESLLESELSPETLAALQEFIIQKEKANAPKEKDGVEEYDEDWQLSQFWV